jgi:pilus assembly protein CpaB
VSSRRTLILIAAILIGVVAAFGLYQYVQKVEEDAKPNPVEVYVITADIERGTGFADAQASITKKTIPAEFRPANYVTTLDELANKVAVTNLAANQVLVQNMFVSADVATTGLVDRLEEGMVAVALPIDGVRGVGGLLQPGDLVNVLVTAGTSAETAATPGQSVDPVATPFSKTARYMYQKVRILTVGDQVRPVAGEAIEESDGTETGETGVIVFEVPPAVAQRLIALDPADIYLTLVSDTWQPTPLGPIDQGELDGGQLAGEDPNRLTPYGPNGFAPAAGN